MANITRETFEANGIEVITDKLDKLWLNERHVQEQLGLKNLPALTNKYDKEYKKQRSELNKSTKQSHRIFIRAALALNVKWIVEQMNHANLEKARILNT